MTFSYWPREKDRYNQYLVDGMRLGDDGILPDIMASRTWAAVVWEPEYRRRVNFKYADWVGLDFDDGPTLDDMTRRLCDMVCIIGTTRSHQKEKRGKVRDRFRVALKLERRCENIRDFEWTMKNLIKKYGADTQAKDGARLLFPCSQITFVNLNEKDSYKQTIDIAPPYKPPKIIKAAGGRFHKSRLFRMVEEMPLLVENRNSTLFKIGLDLKDQGVDPDLIYSEIMRLIPSQPDFTDKEKESIFNSVMRHNREEI